MIDHEALTASTRRAQGKARVGVRASIVPKLAQPIIEVAWRHSGERGRIHYRAKRADGSNRHLIAREGEALYEVLDQHLLAIGYTGPKSAAESSDEH